MAYWGVKLQIVTWLGLGGLSSWSTFHFLGFHSENCYLVLLLICLFVFSVKYVDSSVLRTVFSSFPTPLTGSYFLESYSSPG